MEFYFRLFLRCARLMSDENMHVCKHESKAYMKAKRVNIQKSHVFADLMYIFSENGSTIIFGSYGVNCRCTILFGVIKFTAIGLYRIVLLGQEICSQ